MKNLFVLISALAVTSNVNAQWGLDADTWETLTPFSDSQMTIDGGGATFLNRGILVSAVSFPIAYQVSGSFEFTGDTYNQFEINLRTDGSLVQPADNFPLGTYVAFGGGDNGINSPNPNVKVEDDLAGTVAEANFDFSMNTFYNFSILDTGQSITLYLNDSITPLFTLDTTNREGGTMNLIDMEDNRGAAGGDEYEGENVGVVLDDFSITSVPEPGAATFLVLFSLILCMPICPRSTLAKQLRKTNRRAGFPQKSRLASDGQAARSSELGDRIGG
jgi:hypothetical protein